MPFIPKGPSGKSDEEKQGELANPDLPENQPSKGIKRR